MGAPWEVSKPMSLSEAAKAAPSLAELREYRAQLAAEQLELARRERIVSMALLVLCWAVTAFLAGVAILQMVGYP